MSENKNLPNDVGGQAPAGAGAKKPRHSYHKPYHNGNFKRNPHPQKQPYQSKNENNQQKTAAGAGKGHGRYPRKPRQAQNNQYPKNNPLQKGAGIAPSQLPKLPQIPKEPRLKTALEVIEQSKPKSIRKKPNAKSALHRQKPAQNIVADITDLRDSHKEHHSENGKPSIKVYFLGGLNEIGKNLTVFECGNDMIIVDCGMAFPDDDMPGIDIVIPDFTFIERNADKIRGLVVTHGHEDHIGAIPYLLKKIRLPIYSTSLTLGLIDGKLKEHGLQGKVQLNVVNPGQIIKLGCMGIELIHVNHSISDAVAVSIHSPAGTVIHTGDFKIDCTPLRGEVMDLGRFAELGQEGVLALLADSTNADRPGYTPTERKITASFEQIFHENQDKRLIIATFASNISRVQQIIDCAVRYDRKVALNGRSMLNVMGIASELGYLDIPDGVLIDIDLINEYPKEKIALITTGSQGEPMSSLARMAFADHRKVEVGPQDCVVISARPIPGNEKTVGTVVNELLKRGCKVINDGEKQIHVSGHASQEELKILQSIVNPKYFIPVHGEQIHLRKHAEIAMNMGRKPSEVFVGNNGDCVELNEDFMRQLPSVPSGRILVDGLGVGDVGSIVLRDRKRLAEDGLIIVVCTLSGDGVVVAGPDIVSRGFVYVRESESLMVEAKKTVSTILEEFAESDIHDWGTIKNKIKDDVAKLMYTRTRRSPMILPIIMEV